MKFREHRASETFIRKVLSVLPYGKENATSTNDLCRLLDCTRRPLKWAILALREDYPVCSKDSGGYWIADKDEDIIEFNRIMQARCKTQKETISKMEKHLKGSN